MQGNSLTINVGEFQGLTIKPGIWIPVGFRGHRCNSPHIFLNKPDSEGTTKAAGGYIHVYLDALDWIRWPTEVDLFKLVGASTYHNIC